MFNRRFEAVFDAYEAHLFELFAHPLKSTLFERSGRQQQQEGASDYR
jgi:hypothetical protein